MFTKYVLPIVAVAGLGFAIFTVVRAQQGPPPSRPLIPPPTAPRFRAIAGAGLVEARRENIPIGSNVPGVVWEVFVKVDDSVRQGDPLFRLDDRSVRAEMKVKEAKLVAAEAQLHKLRAAPRPEDVPVGEAAVEEAQARLATAEVNLDRSSRLYQRGAGPASDYDRDRFAAAEARAALARAAGELYRLRKGTWSEDLAVAEAEVEQARADLEASRIELERLTVRAVVDGRVLQVNVRPGQFAALAWKEPLVVLGDLNRLHVRVDIDEQDLPLFRPGARAVATLKGRPHARFDLEFVKVEPYVIPKRSLTGDNTERVDTRVLQVIYALPDQSNLAPGRRIPVYVGQQMDVYLEAAEPPPGVNLQSDPGAPRPFEEPAETTGDVVSGEDGPASD